MARGTEETTDVVREVKLSSNRQVGLAADFARALGVRPPGKLMETLVRLPGVGYAVVLMPRTTSYAKGLAAALAGSAPGGADKHVRKIRGEWKKRG